MWKKLILAAIGILLVFGGGIFYLVRDTGTIYNNVSVAGIVLSNMSKEEAKKKIDEIKLGSLKLTYEGKEYSIPEDEISYKVNSDIVADEAYNVGRKGNFLENKLKIFAFKVLGKKTVVPLHYTLNEEVLKDKIKKIASELDIEEENAKMSLNGDQIVITDGKNGKRVNVEKTFTAAKEAISYGSHNDVPLIVEVTAPKVTREKLNSIDTLLGEYSTTFNSGIYGRTENIKLATNAINEVFLEPNEIISFNESTGMRNAKNGYKSAPVIENGELKQGLGGGVCQVSSTLFNALALSGMKIVERNNHSIPSSYVEIGRDAVVDYGTLDLKVQNNFSNPVYIMSEVVGNKIIIRVYGNKSDKLDEVKLYAVVHGYISRKTKTVKSGKASNGRDGISATTYRVMVKNGNETKEELSKHYYPPKARVVVNPS